MLVDGLRPGLFGLGVGLLLSILATRIFQSMLFGTKPLDPVVLSGVIGMLLVVSVFCLPRSRMAGFPVKSKRQRPLTHTDHPLWNEAGPRGASSTIPLRYSFTSPHDRKISLAPWTLEAQIQRVRGKISTHPDAGLHALRHVFPTEAGEHTDPFTLQYVAGHDNINRTMRCVHPREDAVQKWFGQLALPEIRVECSSMRNPG
jgi:hypothetical protein